jgi:hypothetical protein
MDMQPNNWEESNWTVYRKRYPDSSLTAQQDVSGAAVEILSSRSEIPTLRVTTKTGQKVFLHSSVDPVKEARRVVSALEVQGGTVVVVYGLGLGYLVEALLAQLNERISLFVIEPDQAVFRQAMRTRDLRGILTSDRVCILADDPMVNIGNTFFTFYDVARFHNIVFTGLPGHQTVYSDFHMESMTVIKQVVNSAIMELRNMAKNGLDIVSSTILNFVDYCTNPGVSSLFGKFAGVPAIIVAAGPSLDHNIELLREAKGRALIIAVGTAVKALQKNGITPDFIVSIDAGAYNYEHIKEYNNKDTSLLTDIQSYPRILQNFQGPIFVAAVESFITSWSDNTLEDKGAMETGGTVANSAMTAAYKMGANPIVFVGQDLAFARDGHTHAAGTNYDNIISTAGENEECFYVKANDGGEVLTNRVFDYFRLFIEKWIQIKNDRMYINATEGGAFIAGTQIMTLRDVLATYCQGSVDIKSAISRAHQDCCRLPVEQAVTILHRRLEDAERILEAVTSVVKRVRQLKQAWEKKDTNKINKYVRDINKTFQQFEEDPYIRPAVEILAHHTIHHMMYRRNEALYAQDNDIYKTIADYDMYYKKIYEEAQRVKDLIKQAIKYAEERYEVNIHV